ncbi:MAG: hypothetical protein AAGK14_13655 [Verrucomicrobiota bacterium]
MKQMCLLLVLAGALLGCAQPRAGSVSTIPWEMRAEDDGITAQQWGFYESNNIYTGQIGNPPAT